MKKATSITAVTLLLLMFMTDSALAGGIDHRQAAQQQRIQQGTCRGSLTEAEARILIKEQRHIRQMKKRFLADGVISKAERYKLNTLQDQADTHIRRLKNNSRVTSPLRARRTKQIVSYLRKTAGQPVGLPV